VNIKDLKTTKLEFGKWELERKQRGGRERVQSSGFRVQSSEPACRQLLCTHKYIFVKRKKIRNNK
jgi:hypothetical protein